MSENEQKKPIYKKWWFWLVVIIIIFIIIGSSDSSNTNTITETANNNDINTTNETTNISDEEVSIIDNETTNNYQTSYSWKALEENAYQETIEETRVLSVEIDDYDGIILKAGNYNVYGDDFMTNTNLWGTSYVAQHNRIYTVIVSNIYYNSFNDALADEDNTKTIMWLTWADYAGKTVTLEKGDYVYINHSALTETTVWGDIYLELNEQ